MVKICVILYCGIFLAATVRDYWDIGYAAINLVSIICGTVRKLHNIAHRLLVCPSLGPLT